MAMITRTILRRIIREEITRFLETGYKDPERALEAPEEDEPVMSQGELQDLIYDFVNARAKPKTRARLQQKLEAALRDLANANSSDTSLILQYAQDSRGTDADDGMLDAAFEELEGQYLYRDELGYVTLY
jgi:hypothetical protein